MAAATTPELPELGGSIGQAVTVDARDLAVAMNYNPAKHQHPYPGVRANGFDCQDCQAVFRLSCAIRRRDLDDVPDVDADTAEAFRPLVLQWGAWNAWFHEGHPDDDAAGLAPWQAARDMELGDYNQKRWQGRVDALVRDGLIEEHYRPGTSRFPWQLKLTDAGKELARRLQLNPVARRGCHLCGFAVPVIRNERFEANYCPGCHDFAARWAVRYADKIEADDQAKAEIFAAQGGDQ